MAEFQVKKVCCVNKDIKQLNTKTEKEKEMTIYRSIQTNLYEATTQMLMTYSDTHRYVTFCH